MRCPVCGCCEDRVLDTRPIDEERTIRRRRECLNCLHRFTSYETIEHVPLMVTKRDHTREEFDREKIMQGLRKACQKRPVSDRQMKDLVDKMEADFRNHMHGEVSTAIIGERIMAGLRELDEVAYIRFSSVYKKFDDIDSFRTELENLKRLKEERTSQEQDDGEGESK